MAPSLNPTGLVLATLDIRLGLVVHPESGEREQNADSLHGVDTLREPNDGDANHRNSLDKRCDRISDRRRG